MLTLEIWGSKTAYKHKEQDINMNLNPLKLHSYEDDNNLRQCLRAYIIIPKYCEKPDERNESAIKVVNKLQDINRKLKRRIGLNWRKRWEEKIGFKIKKRVSEEWIRGRASIPLIAIEKLKEFGLEKEVNEIVDNIEYISSTTQGIARIPKMMTPDLLYLSGLILGDGCLPIKNRHKENNLEYTFMIISSSKDFLENKIKPILKELFQIEHFSMRYYTHRGSAWELKKGNKAVYRFFTQIIGLPNGKKSKKAELPTIVKKLEPKQAIPFLAGLIDSDIGKHGRGRMGCTFRSKKLVDDLINLLAKLDIKAKCYGTHFKNNIYIQHDFSIPKSQVKILKDVLVENYLPKRKDRLNTLFSIAGVR